MKEQIITWLGGYTPKQYRDVREQLIKTAKRNCELRDKLKSAHEQLSSPHHAPRR